MDPCDSRFTFSVYGYLSCGWKLRFEGEYLRTGEVERRAVSTFSYLLVRSNCFIDEHSCLASTAAVCIVGAGNGISFAYVR